MKLIKDLNLFYSEGNSDKVYIIEMMEVSDGNYLVNFKYGRRGQAYKEGTKTPSFVPLNEANKIFAALAKEKMAKGYLSQSVNVDAEIPNLTELKIDTREGAILQRLANAVNDTNTFKTEWKTSRVIWAAGLYNIQEAIPFIYKLINKGDKFQVYASLVSLIRLKAKNAEPIFTSYISHGKMDAYLKQIAYEGLLSILDGQELTQLRESIFTKLSEAIQVHLGQYNFIELKSNLDKVNEIDKPNIYILLYLLAKHDPKIHQFLIGEIATLPLNAPYFKALRSIFKISNIRQDALIYATIAVKIEKTIAAYKRKGSYSKLSQKRYIQELEESVSLKSELSSDDSRLAFSHHTKMHLQKASARSLKEFGEKGDAKAYVQLAVAILSHYTNEDYSAKEVCLLNNYGKYNFTTREYIFTEVEYPECNQNYLLTNILFGNDTTRKLTPFLTYYTNKIFYTSKEYYFDRNKVKLVNWEENKNVKSSSKNSSKSYNNDSSDNENKSLFGNIVRGFKNIFSNKNEAENLPSINLNESLGENNAQNEPTISALNKPANEAKEVMFRQHWAAHPEAYIQLLLTAKMDRIGQFAYESLTDHEKKSDLLAKINEELILKLFINGGIWSVKLAKDALLENESNFANNDGFIISILNIQNQDAYLWAKNMCLKNNFRLQKDTSLLSKLHFNTNPLANAFINEFLTSAPLSDEEVKILITRVVSQMIASKEELSEAEGRIAYERLKAIHGQKLPLINIQVIYNLLDTNKVYNIQLASEIALHLSKDEVTFDIIQKMISSNDPMAIKNALAIIQNQDPEKRENAMEYFIDLIHNDNKEVVLNALESFRQYKSEKAIKTIINNLTTALVRKEKFENSHLIFDNEINQYYVASIPLISLQRLMHLVHSNYRIGQLAGHRILMQWPHHEILTIGQINSIGNHELLALRNWCHQYYNDNTSRIKAEKHKALGILSSKWVDTRDFAKHYFKTKFTTEDWDLDTLITIADDPFHETENLGKDLLNLHFKKEWGKAIFEKLSEHPSPNIQLYIAGLLDEYAIQDESLILKNEHYFKSVLCRVNKYRLAKSKVYTFLENHGLKNEKMAQFTNDLVNQISATATLEDKEKCIEILTEIRHKYPSLTNAVALQN